jgi:hypothetical protein
MRMRVSNREMKRPSPSIYLLFSVRSSDCDFCFCFLFLLLFVSLALYYKFTHPTLYGRYLSNTLISNVGVPLLCNICKKLVLSTMLSTKPVSLASMATYFGCKNSKGAGKMGVKEEEGWSEKRSRKWKEFHFTDLTRCSSTSKSFWSPSKHIKPGFPGAIYWW